MGTVIHRRIIPNNKFCHFCKCGLTKVKAYSLSCDDCYNISFICFKCGVINGIIPGHHLDHICTTCQRNKKIDTINEL